jgi:hypothetical protein
MHQVGNDRDASQPHANATRLKDLLAQALDRPEADRRAFLEGECGDDRALLDEAESLLRAAEASGFLKSPTASFVADLPPSESAGGTIGPYKLLQQIGEGGFGAVFMAKQTEPIRRRVALKVIKLGMDTRQVVARFEQERQALAVMDQPFEPFFTTKTTKSTKGCWMPERIWDAVTWTEPVRHRDEIANDPERWSRRGLAGPSLRSPASCLSCPSW